jgi:oligopeptide transport system ATP-binding protein
LPNRILEVRDLVTRFYTPEGVVHAVNGMSFNLDEGETLGIVGESGCGKTVSALSILRLIPDPPGKVERGEAVFLGKDLLQIPIDELRHVRGKQIGMIFQDPMTSLNPVMTIERQVAEPMIEHLGMSRREARERIIELLYMVGIPDPAARLEDYPHQFSGGMRQRAMIAMALSCDPKILIADEPTTALDVTIQAQIIDLVNQLQEKLGMAIIWITHDLGVVARLADRVVVMYSGYPVESASVGDVYGNPRHPYSISLLQSLPRIDKVRVDRLANIEGRPPDLFEEPEFCPFAPRCPFVQNRCREENPSMRSVGERHSAACWFDVTSEDLLGEI